MQKYTVHNVLLYNLIGAIVEFPWRDQSESIKWIIDKNSIKSIKMSGFYQKSLKIDKEKSCEKSMFINFSIYGIDFRDFTDFINTFEI